MFQPRSVRTLRSSGVYVRKWQSWSEPETPAQRQHLAAETASLHQGRVRRVATVYWVPWARQSAKPSAGIKSFNTMVILWGGAVFTLFYLWWNWGTQAQEMVGLGSNSSGLAEKPMPLTHGSLGIFPQKTWSFIFNSNIWLSPLYPGLEWGDLS